MDVRSYVSNKIREYRKLRGLTQKELGLKIGVKHNTISGYENATNEAEQDILFKIANALDVSINDLFPPTTSAISLTKKEEIHIENYRQLDAANRYEIDKLIDVKLDIQKQKSKDTSEKAI